MKKLLFPMALTALLAACATAPVQTVSVQTTPAPVQTAQGLKIKNKGHWIDLRSPIAYEQGHLSGAVNIPVEQLSKRITALDKNATINVYCDNQPCTNQAMQTLQQLGYHNAINQGDYDNLLQQGYR
ncbi:hypothetical protein B0181_03335 [Moraxella caviae]|uniref:Thiosulfate sulfurtransferase PspE n=1 Tax=Moraxella caviae TaxID=34060 RepID=A0A1T0A6Y9_9GAMM|nr:rhodanese-like domain-containing protein [Moraxella caviae]OOR91349.1 hypothetical protein B0181_03335 [Moraxella caviae]STZ13959.1 Thiosulfate sulfurtransferase PspE precursor [Moraxella caviae]VEW13000.1 Thiosulfate sulfurtransferase PspE precursor [Moraxella caviae]